MSSSNFSIQNDSTSTNSNIQGNSDVGNDLTVGRNLTIGGVIDSKAVVLGEQTSIPLDPTGLDKGILWVKSGAPNTLVFTNDNGEDINLNSTDHITIIGPTTFNTTAVAIDIIWGAEIGTSGSTYTYTNSSSTVTINAIGTYLITYNISWENTTGSTETSTSISLQVNSITQTNLLMGIPNTSMVTATQSIILSLTPGDILKIRANGMLTTGTGNTFRSGNWSITRL